MLAHLEQLGVAQVPSAALYPAWHEAADPGLPLLEINNRHGRAVVALQGAQVLSWQPAGREEMLWLSPRSRMQTGKAIRGGIPLCLPWFGLAADGSMQHGFARISDWALTEAHSQSDGSTRLLLELAGQSPQPVWPHAFRFRMEIVLAERLTLTLSAENRSNAPAPLAALFHTYFAVSDVRSARVTGLEQTRYIDKLDASRLKRQTGAVTIEAETDRIYLDVPAEQILHSLAGTMRIESDAKSCVVWNAWDNDRNIADLGAGNHAGYLCVERGNVADHAVTLQPGAKHEIRMTLSELGTHALRGSARFHRQA
ncbi:glucose-6-phosphate 1-epimerase [Formivibrio citricus]|uniref:Putative glucose-6-phosphate 1-epimerase n=1 Tax=Formivibrio citricus TaxID=83765 RepID=A0A1I5B679_9NEIS|nr:D-hexose-6-phosphate mutarotase [Formivibrio citricus]SFN70204.1 glucose-6-phosphate 1-epimerase [Formivibrio citricus]